MNDLSKIDQIEVHKRTLAFLNGQNIDAEELTQGKLRSILDNLKSAFGRNEAKI